MRFFIFSNKGIIEMSFSGFISYCNNAAVTLQKKSFGFSRNPHFFLSTKTKT